LAPTPRGARARRALHDTVVRPCVAGCALGQPAPCWRPGQHAAGAQPLARPAMRPGQRRAPRRMRANAPCERWARPVAPPQPADTKLGWPSAQAGWRRKRTPSQAPSQPASQRRQLWVHSALQHKGARAPKHRSPAPSLALTAPQRRQRPAAAAAGSGQQLPQQVRVGQLDEPSRSEGADE
jgi:hypothetical protein